MSVTVSLPTTRRLVALLAALALLAGLIPGLPLAKTGAQEAAGTTFISEIHYDNDGTDEGEFVEVTAPAGTDLTGWSIVLYNGNDSEAYDADTFNGIVTNQVAGFGTMVVAYPSNGIQNGAPDAIALVDGAGGVVEFISYEGTLTAADGPAAGITSTDIGVDQGSSTPLGASLERTGIIPGSYTWQEESVHSQGWPNPGSTLSGVLLPWSTSMSVLVIPAAGPSAAVSVPS